MSSDLSTASLPMPEANLFAPLSLRPELLRALEEAKYHTPTPIQAAVIPSVLAGEDVLAAAQTGTGKTAGFTLPLLQRLMEGHQAGKANVKPNRAARRPVRALILTPTRELAAQVEESVRKYSRYLPLVSTAIFGGVNMNPQVRALQKGADILVATPGRLLDHVNQRTLDLSQVEIFVLDEADRMLDMGFVKDIVRVLPLMPNVEQRLLFSATFSKEIKDLAGSMLNEPRHIEVARPNMESALVTQIVYPVRTEAKRELLVHLLKNDVNEQVLVFTRTKHGADRLAKQLMQSSITALAIHGNRSQAQRMFALSEFKSGRLRVLVATDIAARGLDIPQLPHVINYEVPVVPEDYVHRIGRTGRAGSTGIAISLVSPDERKHLMAIERVLGRTLERQSVEGFEMPPMSTEGRNTYVAQNSETGGQMHGGDRPFRPRTPGNRAAGFGNQQGRPRPRPILTGKETGDTEGVPSNEPGLARARAPRHRRRPPIASN